MLHGTAIHPWNRVQTSCPHSINIKYAVLPSLKHYAVGFLINSAQVHIFLEKKPLINVISVLPFISYVHFRFNAAGRSTKSSNLAAAYITTDKI